MQKCKYCLKEEADTKDHFYPRSLGGIRGRNIVMCCYSCNRKKGKHLFWSIGAVRSYMRSKRTYRAWLAETIRAVPEKRLVFVEIAVTGRALI